MSIEITVRDTESGDSEQQIITDDYVIITAGRHYVDNVTRHANGTSILTVKVDRGAAS